MTVTGAEAYMMSGMTFVCGLVVATIIWLAIHELSPGSKDWLSAFFHGGKPPRTGGKHTLYCAECADLWDDHQPIEEVDGGARSPRR